MMRGADLDLPPQASARVIRDTLTVRYSHDAVTGVPAFAVHNTFW